MSAPRSTGPVGSYYERPITSERPELLRRVVAEEQVSVTDLLAMGHTTLAAVAVAFHDGDLARAKAAIYGRTPQQ